ncbi:MAG: hypothetical protein RR060_00605 [Victivallaceae bacterium]
MKKLLYSIGGAALIALAGCGDDKKFDFSSPEKLEASVYKRAIEEKMTPEKFAEVMVSLQILNDGATDMAQFSNISVEDLISKARAKVGAEEFEKRYSKIDANALWDEFDGNNKPI